MNYINDLNLLSNLNRNCSETIVRRVDRHDFTTLIQHFHSNLVSNPLVLNNNDIEVWFNVVKLGEMNFTSLNLTQTVRYRVGVIE